MIPKECILSTHSIDIFHIPNAIPYLFVHTSTISTAICRERICARSCVGLNTTAACFGTMAPVSKSTPTSVNKKKKGQNEIHFSQFNLSQLQL